MTRNKKTFKCACVALLVLLAGSLLNASEEYNNQQKNRKQNEVKKYLVKHWCEICKEADEFKRELHGCQGLEKSLKEHHNLDTRTIIFNYCEKGEVVKMASTSTSTTEIPSISTTISDISSSTIKNVETESLYFLIMEWCLYCTTNGRRPACINLGNKLLSLHGFLASNILPNDCSIVGAPLPSPTVLPRAKVTGPFSDIPPVAEYLVKDWCDGCLLQKLRYCDQVTSDFIIYYEINVTAITMDDCNAYAAYLKQPRRVLGTFSASNTNHGLSTICVITGVFVFLI